MCPQSEVKKKALPGACSPSGFKCSYGFKCFYRYSVASSAQVVQGGKARMPRYFRCLTCGGHCVTPGRVCQECQRRAVRRISEETLCLERWATLVSALARRRAAGDAGSPRVVLRETDWVFESSLDFRRE